jgi:hypothetical protein
VQQLLAARFPRPDVPSLIQPLPTPPVQGGVVAVTAPAPMTPGTPSRVEPLSEDRFKVQFTASKSQPSVPDTALRALCAMGFKEAPERRALAILELRWEGGLPPIERILREALTVLT